VKDWATIIAAIITAAASIVAALITRNRSDKKGDSPATTPKKKKGLKKFIEPIVRKLTKPIFGWWSILLIISVCLTGSFFVPKLWTKLFARESPPPEPLSTYQFGDYTWIVLDTKEDKMLLITEDVVDFRVYGIEYYEDGYIYLVSWDRSDVRNYLNGTFLNEFSDSEKDKVRIFETDLVTDNEGKIVSTTDKFFLLSKTEALKYNPPKLSVDWWLRNGAYTVAYITKDGLCDFARCDTVKGIRPAVWITV